MVLNRRLLILSLFWIIIAAGSLAWYLRGCEKMWHANPHWSEVDKGKTYDQVFYVKRALENARGEEYPWTLPRSRMPIYPWFISKFYDPNKSEVEQFETFKRINVTISCFALIGMGFMAVRRLGTLLGLTVALATAFTFFVFKAVLVQPEITFYLLYTFLFLTMMEALKKPSWKRAFAVGLIAGLTHLLKGSALPSFLLFIGFAGLQACWEGLRNWRSGNRDFKLLLRPFLVPVCFVAGFIAVAGYYMSRTKAFYGSALYDPNSGHYLWADSPQEMYAMQQTNLAEKKPMLNLDNINEPTIQEYLPKWIPDETKRNALIKQVHEQQSVTLEGEWAILPSFKNWVATHTLQEAIDRIWNGLFEPEHGLYARNALHRNQYFFYIKWFTLTAAAGVLLMLIFKTKILWEAIRQNLVSILFALGTLACFFLLYAWWVPVSNRNRFFLTQFVPILIITGMTLRWAGSHFPWKTFFLGKLDQAFHGLRLPSPLVTCLLVYLWQTLDNDTLKLNTLDQPHGRVNAVRTIGEANIVQ